MAFVRVLGTVPEDSGTKEKSWEADFSKLNHLGEQREYLSGTSQGEAQGGRCCCCKWLLFSNFYSLQPCLKKNRLVFKCLNCSVFAERQTHGFFLLDWTTLQEISKIWPIHFSCCFLTFELRRSARAIQSSWRSPTEKFSPFSVTSACNFSGSFIIYKT